MNLVDQYAYKYSTVVPRSAQHRRKIHGSRVGVAFSFLGCSFPHGEFVRQRRERRGVALGPWPSPSWAFAPRAPPHLFELEHTHAPVPHRKRSHPHALLALPPSLTLCPASRCGPGAGRWRWSSQVHGPLQHRTSIWGPAGRSAPQFKI